MTRSRLSLALAPFLSVVFATAPFAQQTEQTEPSTTQQHTMPSNSQEAPTGTGTSPAEASSPHQREATDGKMASATSKKEHDKMMNDCVKKQKQQDSSMSAHQAKKNCEDQMKAQSDQMKQR